MEILKSKHLNGWPLFYGIAGTISMAVIGYMPTQDLTVPRGVSEMIQCTVRLSVPFLFLAFAASSMAKLIPTAFCKWLMRNRRYFGLGFASGFAWQLFFILWLAIGHPDYFDEEVFTGVEDLIIYQLGPYTFLTAMTITSFHPVRRKMNQRAWKALHWVGIYWLWYVVELTYWYEVSDYEDRQIIDYIYVATGLLAYLLRVTARIRWGVVWLNKRAA